MERGGWGVFFWETLKQKQTILFREERVIVSFVKIRYSSLIQAVWVSIMLTGALTPFRISRVLRYVADERQ